MFWCGIWHIWRLFRPLFKEIEQCNTKKSGHHDTCNYQIETKSYKKFSLPCVSSGGWVRTRTLQKWGECPTTLPTTLAEIQRAKHEYSYLQIVNVGMAVKWISEVNLHFKIFLKCYSHWQSFLQKHQQKQSWVCMPWLPQVTNTNVNNPICIALPKEAKTCQVSVAVAGIFVPTFCQCKYHLRNILRWNYPLRTFSTNI